MNKLKLALTVLSIATIVWGIVFYTDFQAAHELLEEHSIGGTIVGDLLFYFAGWNSGKYIVLSGVLLAVAWVAFIETTIFREILVSFVVAVRRAFRNKEE